eukprot:m.5225 g.5225  ORF g.5225 m.5225 type:complete len:54 (+) comp2362_c0_seq1:962-1123(+)
MFVMRGVIQFFISTMTTAILLRTNTLSKHHTHQHILPHNKGIHNPNQTQQQPT